jgi:hypothetical protein
LEWRHGTRWTGKNQSIEGKLPDRTYEAIRKQPNLDSLVATNRTAIVATNEPASDALSMDKVVKLFNTAFEQVSALQKVDKLALERGL